VESEARASRWQTAAADVEQRRMTGDSAATGSRMGGPDGVPAAIDAGGTTEVVVVAAGEDCALVPAAAAVSKSGHGTKCAERTCNRDRKEGERKRQLLRACCNAECALLS